MLEHHWVLTSHHFDVEERDRYHRLRATWAEREPVAPPRDYRRRVASLLLAAANWLDPRSGERDQTAQAHRRYPTRAEAMMLVGLPLHRAGRS